MNRRQHEDANGIDGRNQDGGAELPEFPVTCSAKIKTKKRPAYSNFRMANPINNHVLIAVAARASNRIGSLLDRDGTPCVGFQWR